MNSIDPRARRLDRRTWFRAAAIVIVAGLATMFAGRIGRGADRLVVPSTIKTGAGHVIVVKNNTLSEVTVTVTLKLTNMRSSRKTPLTLTLRPRSKNVLLRVDPIDRRQPAYFRYHVRWFWGRYRAKHDDSYVYALPLARGKAYKVGQGYNGEFSHNGPQTFALDFLMDEGQPVHAARDGLVVQAVSRHWRGGPSRDYRDKANFIRVLHDDGTTGVYIHLKKDGVRVKVGQRVARGERIGDSGNTGFSTRPHLHFDVRVATGSSNYKTVPTRFRTALGVQRTLRPGESYQRP